MSVVSQLSVISLKRKAQNLSKKIQNGDESAARYLVSNHPKYEKTRVTELSGHRIPNTEFLHAIAKKNGFDHWPDLLEARKTYLQGFVRKASFSPDEVHCYQHIESAKVFTSVFTEKIIRTVPATYRDAIWDLMRVCALFREHYAVVRRREDGKTDRGDVSAHYYYFFFKKRRMSAEKAIVAMQYLRPTLKRAADATAYEKVGSFYSSITSVCSTDRFEVLLENESDTKTRKIIEDIIKERGKAVRYRDCPICFSPNPPGATECSGCGLTFF
jgi:hypothetical protein